MVRYLKPSLKHRCCQYCNPNSIVVMDIHHVDRVTQLVAQTGASVRFLPPYSPDLIIQFTN